MSVLTLRCSDGSIECGGRFKYIDEEIPMNYHALVDAISRAIDKELNLFHLKKLMILML